MLRRLSVNLGLILGSVIFALGVMEVGLRLYDGVPLLHFTNFISQGVDRLKTDPSMIYDERLGWRPAPNTSITAEIRGVPIAYHIDSYGDRITGGGERLIPQGAILAAGDSFTLGTDVTDDGAWPAILEEMTGAPVINASGPGWGTDQIVMRAEAMIELAHPKTLILGFLWFDMGRAEDEINFGSYKPYYTVDAGTLTLHNVPVPRMVGNVYEMGFARGVLGHSYAIFWAAQRAGLSSWLDFGFNLHKRATPPGTGERITCLLMDRVKQRLAGESTRLMLVMEYTHRDFGAPQPKPAVEVLGCARELGFDTVDMWDALAKIFAADPARFLSLFVVDRTGWSHMSTAGNQLVAAAIAQRLREAASADGSRH